MDKQFLRIDEAAKELDTSSRTIYRLIQEGAFLAFPIRQGGALRIPVGSFKRYVRDSILRYQEENCITPQETVTDDDKQ